MAELWCGMFDDEMKARWHDKEEIDRQAREANIKFYYPNAP